MLKRTLFCLLTLIIFSEKVYTQIPTITSFSPISAQVGDAVAISGTNFAPSVSGNKVFFGYTQAVVTSATTTNISVIVPSGATYESIKVLNTASSLMGSSSYSFIPVSACSGSALDANSFAAFEQLQVASGAASTFAAIDDLDGDGVIDIVVGDAGSSIFTNTTLITIFRNESQPSLFSFDPKQTFTINKGTYLLADFDGDGKKDIISVNSGNGISILKNISTPGNISFAAQVNIAIGNSGNAAVGDLDGDGKLDLVIAYSGSNQVLVIRNKSTANAFSFDAAVIYNTGFNPNTPCIADIDGDGKLDISVTNANDNNVSVYKNTCTTGSISFASRVSFTTGVNPQAIYAADVDNDGQQDLIVANVTSKTISFLKNTSATGVVSFASKNDFATSAAPIRISLNDMDGDGKPDVIVANNSALTGIDVFLNNTTGGIFNLTARQTLSTSNSYLSDFTTGDLDGDSKPDIIGCDSYSQCEIYRNQMNIPLVTSFNPSTATPGSTLTITGVNFTGATSVRLGGVPVSSFTVLSSTSIQTQVGLGRTGFIEVVTPCGITTNKSLLTISSNIPKITSFTPEYGSVGSTVTITGLNFNPVASNNIVSFGSIAATIVSGTTTQLVVKVPLGSNYQPISVLETASDLIALSDRQFTTTPNCTNPLDANFFNNSQLVLANTPNNASNIYIDNADFDGDGKPDLIIPVNNYLSVYRNVSKVGQFLFDSSTIVTPYVYYANPWYAQSGDLDGDGKPDLVVVNKGANNITVYKNMSTPGHISFNTGVNFTTGTSPIHVTLSDLNKDGKLDIIITNGNNSISVLKNTGDVAINFAAKVDYAGLSAAAYSIIGDIDGDQMPEVIVANTNSSPATFSIFPNTSIVGGAITLGTIKSFSAFGQIKDLCIGDIDRDDKLDVIVALANYVSVYRNISTVGTMSFDSALNLPTNNSQPINKISLSDLDADGKPEVAALYNTGIFVFKNTSIAGSLSFNDALQYAIGGGSCFTIKDFDGDGAYDLISPFSSVSNGIQIIRTFSNFPVISYFTPVNATPGTTVTFVGQNFSSVTDVQFADVSASSFAIISPTLITAVVGGVSIGSTGNVSLASPCGNLIRSGYSCYTIPAITSFTPASGKTDDIITIKGNNFNNIFSNNIVFFGAVKAIVLSGDNSTLTLKVPTGATFQPITVLDSITGLMARSSQPFLVTNTCTSAITSSSFGTKVDNTTVSNPTQVSVADFNDDRKPELVIASQSTTQSASIMSVFKNTSVNNILSFDPKFDLLGGRNNVICDINADGKLDIVSTNSGNNVFSVFINSSSGGIISFAPKVDFSTNTGPDLIAADDLDGDGKTDIVVLYGSLQLVSIYRNISSAGSLLFAPAINISIQHSFNIILLSDLDGDNKSEMIGLNNVSETNVFIYKNISEIGTIAFNASSVSIPGGSHLGGVCVGDFDKDGKSDVAVTSSYNNTVSVARNTSTYGVLSFAANITLGTATYPGNASVGDIDGDGNIELIVANYGAASVSVFKVTSAAGSGNISFSAKTDFATGTYPVSPVVADLTGDGRPEITTVSQLANVFSILKNNVGNIAQPVTGVVQYCKDAVAMPLTATGASLLWYKTLNGGTGSAVAPTPSTDVSGTAFYYVSQTISGCESSRAQVTVTTAADVLAPQVTSPVNYCKSGVASVLTATGNSLKWYYGSTDLIGTSDAPTPATNTSGTVSYYVSQNILGCESPKAQIDVITSTSSSPDKPSVSTPVSYNQNDISGPLTAIGTNLLWYTVSAGGAGSVTAPVPNTSSPDTFTYYVSQTVNGCESLRASVTVLVKGMSTGINTGVSNERVLMYPNPATSDIVTIEINSHLLGTGYSLMDQTGVVFLKGKLLEEKNVINIEQLLSGVYIVCIEGAANFKLIKLK